MPTVSRDPGSGRGEDAALRKCNCRRCEHVFPSVMHPNQAMKCNVALQINFYFGCALR